MRWFQLAYKPGLKWWQFRKRWLMAKFLKVLGDCLEAHTHTPDLNWWSLK